MCGRRRSSLVNVDRTNDSTIRVKDESIRRLSRAHEAIGQQQADAKAASDDEKALTVRSAIRLYKRAIMFSLAMSLAVVMEGYDLAAMGKSPNTS